MSSDCDISNHFFLTLAGPGFHVIVQTPIKEKKYNHKTSMFQSIAQLYHSTSIYGTAVSTNINL